VLISVRWLSRPKTHNVAGRIRTSEKSSDFIGNRFHDLLAYSLVPQPTTLPRAPNHFYTYNIYNFIKFIPNENLQNTVLVLTAVVIKSYIFWDIMPCSLLKINRRFGGPCRLNIQGQRISREINQRESRWHAEQSNYNFMQLSPS
jgi:hypothetical protein